MRAALVLLLLAGCGEEELSPDALVEATVDAGGEDASQLADAGGLAMDAAEPKDAGELPDTGEMRPETFIGSPCEVDGDCTYEGGVCLIDGFPMGSCSLGCDRICPDRDGFPTTFCVATSDLPSAGTITTPGACISRCSFGDFPENGCREGYGCVDAPRVNEPSTIVSACKPGEETMTTDCMGELAAANVDFEPTTIADQSPDGYPNLTCHVEDPVVLHPPVHGVDVKYFDATATPNVRGACTMILALVKSIDDVASRGVTAVRHIGTYNCRVIAGTDRLSRHAYGDAIDIYGFEIGSDLYTLIDHWEHDTMMPTTTEGIFLYETAHRWHDSMFWTIILTPNYNAAHDNHFHVDQTPGSDFIQLLPSDDIGYIGPAPYAD